MRVGRCTNLEYFAFGETFVEEHSNTDRTPYLFNGKELDEETGLYYYGARYYDARTSVFQSIDPMADHFPSLSSYQFAGNRVPNMIDLDGLEPVGLNGFIPPNLLNPSPPPPAPGWRPPMALDHVTTTAVKTQKSITTTKTLTITGEVLSTSTQNRTYDLPGGKNIPDKIEVKNKNGTTSIAVTFIPTGSDSHSSNNKMSGNAVDKMAAWLQQATDMGVDINSIGITATTNGDHGRLRVADWDTRASNHHLIAGARAFDVGLINGKPINKSDSSIFILQQAADSIPGINENLGPFMLHKRGREASTAPSHPTHLHISFD